MTNAEIIVKLKELQAELSKNVQENGNTGVAIASSYINLAANCLKER